MSFTASPSREMLKLPPISAMDDYLNKNWTPESTTVDLPTPSDQWKSPPYNNQNELYRDSAFKPLFSTNLSPPIPYQQKPRTSYFQRRNSEASSPSYHSISLPATYRIEQDIEEVIQQCNTLSNSMSRNQPQFIHSPHLSSDSSRPWLDDMIGRANEVLNALLRLRKHQIATEQQQQQQQNQPQYQQQQQQQQQPQHQHQQQSFEQTYEHHSPSHYPHMITHSTIQYNRQRKRGRRPAFQGRCHSCNISETPEWRRGPDGARTLCNACGLHYAKLARRQQANRQNKLTPPADNDNNEGSTLS